MLLQRRHREDMKTRRNEKMLNITNHQRNTNQKHTELPPNIRMAIIEKTTNKKCWQGCGEKGNLVHC